MAEENKIIETEEIKMPLLDHLIELRTRLLRSAVAILVMIFACYYFAPAIYDFLVQPFADSYTDVGRDGRLIFTALHEAFFTYIKVAFFAAIFLSFPFISIQFWMFVAPGLYKHEKRALMPFLVATPILFFMGGALVYYFIFPLAWKFFLSFEAVGGAGTLPIQLEAKVDQYLSLVMRLIFAFGICFELPVVMTLLARVGLAILTPPDVISQIGLAVPTIALYEISIIAVKMIEKNRGDEEVSDDDDDEPDTDGDDVAEDGDEDKKPDDQQTT